MKDHQGQFSKNNVSFLRGNFAGEKFFKGNYIKKLKKNNGWGLGLVI